MYNESFIVEMIQRLELIGEDQLIKAFENKQAQILEIFKKNRGNFSNLFQQLSQLAEILDKFIFAGSLEDIIQLFEFDITSNCEEAMN